MLDKSPGFFDSSVVVVVSLVLLSLSLCVPSCLAPRPLKFLQIKGSKQRGTHTVLSVYAFFMVSSSLWCYFYKFDYAIMQSESMTDTEADECRWLRILAAAECHLDWLSCGADAALQRVNKSASVTIKMFNKVLSLYMCVLKIYWQCEIWKESEANTMSHFYSSSLLMSHTRLNFNIVIIMKKSKLLICTLKDITH